MVPRGSGAQAREVHRASLEWHARRDFELGATSGPGELPTLEHEGARGAGAPPAKQASRAPCLPTHPRGRATGLTAMYELHFEVLRPYFPLLLRGLFVTTYVSLAAMAVGTVLGLLLALARLSGFIVLSAPCRILVDFVRGVPALVLLIYIYYGVSIFLGLNVPAMVAAIGGLGIFYAAYLSETFRAGIQAVDRGQIEAAMSLGMRRTLIFRRVIAPHAFRIVLPPLTNSFISLFKDSSLVSVSGDLRAHARGSADHDRNLPRVRGAHGGRADLLRDHDHHVVRVELRRGVGASERVRRGWAISATRSAAGALGQARNRTTLSARMRAAACSSASGTDSFARWAAFERLPGPKIRVGMPADWNVAASVLPRRPEYPRSLPRIRAVVARMIRQSGRSSGTSTGGTAIITRRSISRVGSRARSSLEQLIQVGDGAVDAVPRDDAAIDGHPAFRRHDRGHEPPVDRSDVQRRRTDQRVDPRSQAAACSPSATMTRAAASMAFFPDSGVLP